ncbi:MAG: cyclase family protein [Defluviitaleaceae bacterium]|nr:cyclase family protein [Defluviitaleaceae bacterium]
MKIYDITAEISNDLPVFGKERPVISIVSQLANGDAYNFSNISVSAHTGTHADMPLHFILGGATCSDIPLGYFYGPAKVVRINVSSHVCKADLVPLDIQAGDIILLDTGQSQYMRQGVFKQDFIALTPEAADYLVEKEIKTIGIDYLSIDPYDNVGFPAHKALLGNGIAILEGLVLENVPEGTYTLSALPLKIPGGEGSPVRAILVDEHAK